MRLRNNHKVCRVLKFVSRRYRLVILLISKYSQKQFQIETISLPTQTRKKQRTYWGKASAKQCSPPKAKIKRLRMRHTKSKTCHSSQSATHFRNLGSNLNKKSPINNFNWTQHPQNFATQSPTY